MPCSNLFVNFIFFSRKRNRLWLAAVFYDVVSAWLHMLSRGRVFTATVGESIRLDCDFRTNQFDLFENPLSWEKIQFSSDAVPLNMMGNILEPFASTKRFQVKLTQQPPNFSLILTINGWQRLWLCIRILYIYAEVRIKNKVLTVIEFT